MGSGSFTTSSFRSYSTSRGRTVNYKGVVTSDSLQDFYQQTHIHEDLKPYKVVRECCDSEEHPNTIPVIIGLDVTGSMGRACVKTAQNLNTIITSLYDKFDDIEFMIMGIGDLAYDFAPIQASQFESDVRIAEHLDKVYMEHGGGGNGFESYTAAWYFGLHHTKLDCWKRGKKGIIITMGDEPLNPYLPKYPLEKITGDNLEADVETKDLYELTKEKFDIYHIAIDDADDCYYVYKSKVDRSFKDILKEDYKISTLDELPSTIVKCIESSVNGYSTENSVEATNNNSNLISW
jgi:hypothetical protein